MGAADTVRHVAMPLRVLIARTRLLWRRHRFTGAYPDRAAALAAAPAGALKGYDHDAVVDVSQSQMRMLKEWDYPVLLWLDRILREAADRTFAVLDAGGHVGTKYYAFRKHIDLSRLDWRVWDLPPMVAAGKTLAEHEGVSHGLSFTSRLDDCGLPDIMVCSGLLQYLDRPFTELVNALAQPPGMMILNKVALRDGPGIFTLERIGPAFVPYQFRNRVAFEREIHDLGYEIIDQWRIEALANRIASHPEFGAGESAGYFLRRR